MLIACAVTPWCVTSLGHPVVLGISLPSRSRRLSGSVTAGPFRPACRQVVLATSVGGSRSRPQVANGLRRADSPYPHSARCKPELAKGAGDDRSVEQMYGERETGLEPAT